MLCSECRSTRRWLLIIAAALWNSEIVVANSQCLTDADCRSGARQLVCDHSKGANRSTDLGECVDVATGAICNCVSQCVGPLSVCYTNLTSGDWQYCSSCNEWDGFQYNSCCCSDSTYGTTSCDYGGTCSWESPHGGYCSNGFDFSCDCQTPCAYEDPEHEESDYSQGWCFNADNEIKQCSACRVQVGVYRTENKSQPCSKDSECSSTTDICHQNGVCSAFQSRYCEFFYCGDGDGPCSSDTECAVGLKCSSAPGSCQSPLYPSGTKCCTRRSRNVTGTGSTPPSTPTSSITTATTTDSTLCRAAWEFDVGGQIAGRPAFSPNEGILLVGSYDTSLYAINTTAVRRCILNGAQCLTFGANIFELVSFLCRSPVEQNSGAVQQVAISRPVRFCHQTSNMCTLGTFVSR